MSFPPDRTLLKALIVSLLAHALLLLGMPRLLPVVPDTPPATILVAMKSAKTETGKPPALQPEVKAVAKPAAPRQPEPPKSHPRIAAVPDQLYGNVVASVPAASAVEQDAGTASPATVPASGSVTGSVGDLSSADVRASGTGTRTSGQEGVSAEDVRQYRTSLAISARRFKRYPALAKERGWEGSVEVSLNFRHLRPDPDVSITSSSGRTILDDQALEMIRQAARVADLPERLKGGDFRVVLPITFSLNDER